MKKIFLVLITGLILWGCDSKTAQKKAILDSVLAIHDKVMGSDEQLMNNKLKIDTLIKQRNLSVRDPARLLRSRLEDADVAMNKWMRGFDPEFKGKTDDETIEYFEAQKKTVTALADQIGDAVSKSNQYLKTTAK